MSNGVLIVNLGTPHSASPRDVKAYLHEFLLDKKVMDLPWITRQLLVRGMIVPKRYKESARCYSKIWQEEGSPLLVYGKKLESYLQQKLLDCEVVLAMRYQRPSIGDAILHLINKKITKLLVFPLFPQYASATTGSIFEKVIVELKKKKYFPDLSFIQSFATDDFFIRSICKVASKYDIETYDHILFSFHGLPQKHVKKIYPNYCCQENNSCCQSLSDNNQHCYAAQCVATTKQIIANLELTKPHTICFQSRLGKDPWLLPGTVDTIKQLALTGTKRVLVFCPSFVCDCLETLYEIGMEYGELFKRHGGETLDLVEGLNNHPIWQDELREMIVQNLKQKTQIVDIKCNIISAR
ncbi:MAG: ferrochelatase [Chlamydiales bacterium]|nr:ferrochelatase [Chlamydiales bacterium]